jgi:hypothetical protein
MTIWPARLQMIISSITANKRQIIPSVAQENDPNHFSTFEILAFFHLSFPKCHKKMHKAPKALQTPAVRVLFVAATTTRKNALVNILNHKINFPFWQPKLFPSQRFFSIKHSF